MCKPRNDRVRKPRCFATGRHALSRLRPFVARGPRADRGRLRARGDGRPRWPAAQHSAHRCAYRGGARCRRPGPWSRRRPRPSGWRWRPGSMLRSAPPQTANLAADDGVNRRDGRGWRELASPGARSESPPRCRHGGPTGGGPARSRPPRRDPAIALTAILARHLHHRSPQPVFLVARGRAVSLRPSPLPQPPARTPLPQPMLLPGMLYRASSPFRA